MEYLGTATREEGDRAYLGGFVQERLDQIERKVDRVVAFIETVEKGMEVVQGNPMLRALLPKDLGGRRNG